MSSRSRLSISQARLGSIISGLAVLATYAAATFTAAGGDLLRGGYTGSASGGSGGAQTFTPPTLAQQRQNARDVLARTTQAVQAAVSLQTAARKIAAASALNNLGKNPNNPGQTLPNVPNGLNLGGLVPDSGLQAPGISNPVTTWTGVTGAPTQTTSGNKTIVTVVQNKPDAILNWNTFNIGKSTTLAFNQSKGGADTGKWIAFNIIRDPSGAPSQILGAMTAPGQVYVINQNGIIFGGASQINLHGLVASSLPINTYLISRGLLNNPDDQFLFSALAQPTGVNGSPAFTPPASYLPNGNDGDVIVQAGAEISTPDSANHTGGRVALIGPNVTNNGTINTPDGQTILAAGLQVGFAAHPVNDPTLRGLDVYIGQVQDPTLPGAPAAGTVTNQGLIEVPRGDITMAGQTVNQLGDLDSSTSVALNGRIDLLADYNSVSSGGATGLAPYLPGAAGVVTLGANSVTQILPELSSLDRVVGTQLALSSLVNIQGHVIHMATGSVLLAPSAMLPDKPALGTDNLNLVAGVSLDAGTWDLQTDSGSPQTLFVHTGGQVYLDAGSIINVAGSADVSAPVSENIVPVQLRGIELADSPTQRNGAFRGQTIYIDIRETGVYNGVAWVGTPLANASGYVGLIERTVGELTTAGGTVSLQSGGSVVMQPGSTVDVSNGWIDYQGGVVETSAVVSGGHIYDISQATPDLVYGGFNLGTFTSDHLKYGLSETFQNPLMTHSHYEASYVQGGDGGSISIVSPSVALDGALLGSTAAGPRQRSVLPKQSDLSIAFQSQQVLGSSASPISPTPPRVLFGDVSLDKLADPFSLDSSGEPLALPAALQGEVVLSPELLGDTGFGSLAVADGDGSIDVPANVALTTKAGGSITLSAANLDVEGTITSPGGSISLTTYDVSPFISGIPAINPGRGRFTLGASASLSTAGLIINDSRGAAAPGTLPLLDNGGTVSINAYSAFLEQGSSVDVSGGAIWNSSGKISYGNGGAIAINAGQDPTVKSILGGKLLLDANLEGFSGAEGGSLEILAPLVQIGGVATHGDTLLLDPAFFDQGGFASYSINGLGEQTSQLGVFLPAVVVAAGVQVDPVAVGLVAIPDATAPFGLTLSPVSEPVGVRKPVSFSLGAPGVTDILNSAESTVRGDIVIEPGAIIRTDPLGSVSLAGNTVAVFGSILAPGGTINIAGDKNSTGDFTDTDHALPTVELGAGSLLSTAGTVVYTPNARGFHPGVVLPGGSISVSGNIVAESGATLDVSGVSGVVDLSPAYDLNGPEFQAGAAQSGQAESGQPINGSFAGAILVPTEVASNGGFISLTGGQELFTDATLIGNAGGPSAIGGSLSISSGRFVAPGSAASTAQDINLIVTQGGQAIPSSYFASGGSAIGRLVVDDQNQPLAQLGHFAVDDFSHSGFDSLNLGGTVDFSGPVSIAAAESIKVATSGVLYADSTVHLAAPYVALGTPFQAPMLPQQEISVFLNNSQVQAIPPTFGSGSLVVEAGLIDIGNLTLQGIGNAKFIADQGDIRGDGFLDIAGNIYMRAGQVYPPTAVSFTISAYDYTENGTSHEGSVTFASSGVRPLPLSAGGSLNVYASVINQGGVLRAPDGTINLGWDGTGTAPIDLITLGAEPITSQVTLSAGSVTSVSAIDPITGQALLIPYGLNLNGTSWISPTGADITAGGVPSKLVNISGGTIDEKKGAVIDIRGGGDLYAYQFVPGIGGSTDILASTSSFAILPGYQFSYAPYAPFNPNPGNSNFGTDPGYVNGKLAVGDQIYLQANNGMPAGFYTLLPARYALLPGAFLVTPRSGSAVGTFVQPDGSSIVSGYRVNGFDNARTGQGQVASFEVASQAVVKSRAEYDDYYGNAFLLNGAVANNSTVPRLPKDSGQLIFNATQAMSLQGSLLSESLSGGLGGLVDISSPADIVIAGPSSKAAGGLILNSADLSSFGAASLLIGGTRTITSAGTVINVSSEDITVDNAGAPLKGADIILAANDSVDLADDSVIESTGASTGAGETILVNGNGALVRVSNNPADQVLRSGVTSSTSPSLAVGAGVQLSGGSITLDSTHATSLDPTATIHAKSIALNSGQISIQLDSSVPLLPTSGLVLSGNALQTLQGGAQSLALLSYSSIDLYGSGQIGALKTGGGYSLASLALHAGEIRGFTSAGGTITFNAQKLLLDNRSNVAAPGATAGAAGTLVFNADNIQLGAHSLSVDQFTNVQLNAAGDVLATANGSFSAQQALAITAGLITGAKSSVETVSAGGALSLNAAASSSVPTAAGGLGATLSFVGASVDDNAAIVMPTGSLTLHATSGDLTIGDSAAARIDVSGMAKTVHDVTEYTDGGQITLISDAGNVTMDAGSTATVSAQPGGGDAGLLTISAPKGDFVGGGTLLGHAGAGGKGGSFSLDVTAVNDLASLESVLSSAGFDQAQSIRGRTGSVTVAGVAKANSFILSADQGSIDVVGTIDASGVTGGTIDLVAAGSVTLENGSKLTAAAQDFSDAGKGGAISLEAGSETNGSYDTGAAVDIGAGSTIDLSVAANTSASAAAGDFTGALHLRAPQLADGSDLQVGSIDGTIKGASVITAEGYKIYDLTASGGQITSAVEAAVNANGQLFLGAAGTTTAGYTAMQSRLLANNSALGSILVLENGAEIINTTGNLTLGTTTSTAASDWNLANDRYGPNGAAGVLTLRAAGNVVFYNALNDGFATSDYTSKLLTQNQAIPANAQSWSYRVVAGADLAAADFRRLESIQALDAQSLEGSIQIGKNGGQNTASSSGAGATAASAVNNHFQVLRTGSGDIDLFAGRNVQLLNQFATVYTAGTQVVDPTMGGTFDVPRPNSTGNTGNLGVNQENPAYTAQYSYAGGNVTINSQGDILHQTQDIAGNLIADSERELPTSWLYRRGAIDPTTGLFIGTKFNTPTRSDIGSTTWWVDFSNFFEGVGALGGGNVSLIAGGNVTNVDAVVPTNARMPGKSPSGPLAPNAASLVELGGGDLLVSAGLNIDGGAYYVESGHGELTAGGSIVTNSTRSPTLVNLSNPATIDAPETWLPTTLFVGAGSFDVSARGDILLGPVANPFLLPAGFNNSFWYKTYFSTYATSDAVDVTSLGGDVTLREATTLPNSGFVATPEPILQAWYQGELLLTQNPGLSASNFQPWLRLDEDSVQPFTTAFTLMPSTLRATSLSGNINVVGNITLSPSPTGTVDLVAAGSINGLQEDGQTTLGGVVTNVWATSQINLSDADPNAIYGITTPFAYQNLESSPTNTAANQTMANFLLTLDQMFTETGSTEGAASVIQAKQALHDAGVLHSGDSDPVHVYAEDGSISGITLFSGKTARVIAGQDVTDIALYIQNVNNADVTVVSSGRDIVAYDPNSTLRVAAQAAGNVLSPEAANLAGDIQISGPGTLEVLAGRNLTLGVGPNNADGTGVGITSIGNARNPALPFDGASIFAAAGLGAAAGFDASSLDFKSFINQFVNSADGAQYISDLAATDPSIGVTSAQAFAQLSPEQQDLAALDLFFIVLRDAGRDHNLIGSPGYGNYAAGTAAISALFPSVPAGGDISLTSREIKTTSGGDINLLAPAGQLTVGFDIAGNEAVDQGILTEDGGNISIFTKGSVVVGTSRIFTLRGGNEIIWSSEGDIAAGASSKTVQSAPPTRVLIDPQSADISTDLAGLATGGGIGVLDTVADVPPGDIDLIAPTGTIDAGDAGIRVTGNLSLAAVQVLNASNIQAGGASSGVPSVSVAAPNIGAISAASATVGATTAAANEQANNHHQADDGQQDAPSDIDVEVLVSASDDESGQGG